MPEFKLTQSQINSSQDSHFGIPFGGYKQSGIGRELGQYALSAYTQVKAVHGKFAYAVGERSQST
jgi:acyl-CoA reductase-like NAD-dependent aldehyde dehydrogenase